MIKILQNHLLIIFGWFFIGLGLIGVILPILPTTPFLLIALALFSKSSPRFHKMLLNNAWFGPTLKQWEAKKALPRRIKYKIYFIIIISFSISIAIFADKVLLQLLLVGIAVVLLFFIWRIKEAPLMAQSLDDE
ncbi:YbaN family protein [Candidatus Venteria ishoeyi]|uniref:Inner membrane protein n=1 Tax=Candidatus Venteria ishoeyi TaxID=1899563 RepID=A0A1H6F2G6_9GAMM|nr:YbaN family protein [Candidatus Venteria ishoeyi]MDM8546231.1 YbaN family protein [Candidatus Venteria ishoeyi]SEH04347.1 Inner membrane protein YbaN [Candidatus Venteria ishoeyi]